LRRAQRVPLHRVAGRRAAVLRRHLLPPSDDGERAVEDDAQARRPAQLRRRAAVGAALHLIAKAPMRTVHDRFVASAAAAPGDDFVFVDAVTAQSYGIAAGAIRWGDAAAEVERLRAAYAAAGYGHGHRVGLLLENRPAFLLHWFALNGLGVSVVPIHAELRAAELEYLIGHSE